MLYNKCIYIVIIYQLEYSYSLSLSLSILIIACYIGLFCCNNISTLDVVIFEVSNIKIYILVYFKREKLGKKYRISWCATNIYMIISLVFISDLSIDFYVCLIYSLSLSLELKFFFQFNYLFYQLIQYY